MDYVDIDNFVDDVAEADDYDPKAVRKALKKACKALDIKLPSKPALGKGKMGIVNYFAANELEDTSITGLSEFLYDNNCCKATPTDTAEEACLRQARQLYTFATLLIKTA